MKIPAAPERGHVIRYAYLWADERDRGQQEGLKDRPTLVVAISILEQTKLARVLVVAIAHTPPRDSSDAVLRSADIARRLGLNHESSWIVTTEANGFVWPGPDLRPIPGKDPTSPAYGRLPDKLLTQVIRSLLENRRKGKVRVVTRSE